MVGVHKILFAAKRYISLENAFGQNKIDQRYQIRPKIQQERQEHDESSDWPYERCDV
ncbi:uncharacterized protein G2W53_039358 [Senna tora]|uniref:Uncharacterized protein n=1 Tax=Senna tora TaxID=362788 RepID=A0A834ST78_9FABA|nr:uncharacterized protein G2W53_039358 [Senna tora]